MAKPVSNDADSQKKLKEQIAKRLKVGVPRMLKYLEDVVKGKESEERVTPKGDIVTVKIPASVRVSAAKVYAAYLHKEVPDKKDTQKHEHEFNLTDAIKEVAESKKAEAKKVASGGGNLVEFPHGKAAD